MFAAIMSALRAALSAVVRGATWCLMLPVHACAWLISPLMPQAEPLPPEPDLEPLSARHPTDPLRLIAAARAYARVATAARLSAAQIELVLERAPEPLRDRLRTLDRPSLQRLADASPREVLSWIEAPVRLGMRPEHRAASHFPAAQLQPPSAAPRRAA